MGESVLNGVRTAGAASRAAGFHRVGDELTCDGVPLAAIATAVGTPTYVYSAAFIRQQFTTLSRALAGVPHRLHYSVKANANLAILRLLRDLGAGVDIVSGGELHRSLAAGFSGVDVVFSGVGKSDAEMRQALAAGVRLFNVESEGELVRLDAAAAEQGVRAPVALRVNPDVTVDTPHPYTRTGEKGMKFGIPDDRAEAVGLLALGMRHVSLIGLDMHIGSQVSETEPYLLGARRLLELLERLQAAGATELRTLDIGGGLAVSYEDEAPMDVARFAAAVVATVAPTGLDLILEPGRFLVGNAGMLITRVLDRKHSGGKEHIITDAGMNDLLRPSHYNAYHRIEPVVRGRGQTIVADIVGPICESGDFLALDRAIEEVSPGALLGVYGAGAYGFAMASNYNSRPRAAEVLVDGDRFAVARPRETYEDMVRHENLPLDWSSPCASD
ncbi:MAG TPA: diaminopimelate decarboxylase [Gemmatimonadaceae bacterium]|nr:diaminopimelate decarboxylase [Gemmatimonadaceae bacterium]